MDAITGEKEETWPTAPYIQIELASARSSILWNVKQVPLTVVVKLDGTLARESFRSRDNNRESWSAGHAIPGCNPASTQLASLDALSPGKCPRPNNLICNKHIAVPDLCSRI